MHKNLISVIMGIYNCADTLPEAINSIVAQAYTNWQLIMCDDCSTDSTYDVAKSFVEQYPDKMILIRNEKNMSLAYSLNHCLEYADGEYVARMDGDDLSAPDRFQKQIDYLRCHPDIQLVGTAMQQFNEKDGNIQLITKPEHVADKYIMHKRRPFHHATIMTYKYVYDSLSGYTVADRTARCEDYDLWFRFLYNGFSGDNINEPLYFVREDMNAIKRRTFKSRWDGWKTTKYGYELLGYPKMWLIKEFLITFGKSITPAKAQYYYRKLQQMQSKKTP